MVRIQFLLAILVVVLLNSCGSSSDAASFFEIQLEGSKKQFQNGTAVGVRVKNKKEKSVNTITYSLDGKELLLEDGKILLNVQTLGNKMLKAQVDYDDSTVEIEHPIRILASAPPELYTYEVLNTFPHDKTAYTQGLEFYGDTLYESTGNPGYVANSKLKKMNFQTGEVYAEIDLEKKVFGEGLTIINEKVIQLTWQSGFGYVYDPDNLERQQTFSYGASKEGWGLCNNGEVIYKSDGTEKIWILDPDTLSEQGYIETVTNKSIFNKANELEYVDGKIYANVWQKESMMIIDPTTGAIEGVVNFGGLKDRVEQHKNLDVFNGVAYHPKRQTFFVTGKNWDTLFEVKIVKK